MRSANTGLRPAALAAMLLVSGALAGCTTTEGTNAFSSPQTFETEVMDSTAQGLGLIPTPVKADPTNVRGPLVMPKSTGNLPPPTAGNTETAMLPEDSDRVKFDSAGLSADQVQQVKDARVVTVSTPDGRPLTPAEIKKLTAKMKNPQLSTKRSLFVPPAEYFTEVGNKDDLVCLAKNGDLVAVNDPNCPVEIRKALLKKG